MQAVIVKTHDEFEAAGPGAILLWRYGDKSVAGGKAGYIMLKCPGCGQEGGMHVRDFDAPHPAEPQQSWIISGLPDKITLQPSINFLGCCKWHGYLAAGEYKKC